MYMLSMLCRMSLTRAQFPQQYCSSRPSRASSQPLRLFGWAPVRHPWALRRCTGAQRDLSPSTLQVVHQFRHYLLTATSAHCKLAGGARRAAVPTIWHTCARGCRPSAVPKGKAAVPVATDGKVGPSTLESKRAVLERLHMNERSIEVSERLHKRTSLCCCAPQTP